MSKPWEQQPGEPDRSYSRFHHYLLLGPERSIDEAYRTFPGGPEKAANRTGGGPPRRPPGSWKEAAARWNWAERARAYDEDERRRLRRAHYDVLEAMNERHQKAAAATFTRSLRALAESSTEGLSFPQALAAFERAVNLERRVMGEPLGVELIVRGARPFDEDRDDARAEAAAVAPERFEASPAMYAEVARLLGIYEPPSAEGGPGEAPPRGDGGPDAGGAPDDPEDDQGPPAAPQGHAEAPDG